ncbi:hypothetical protein [Streptomyces sp. CBMA152]|uniref:hypothetical protein n=1 Tax=Streptomyces sp. CBMA152 TaxID=1896312 RepID=UPI001660AEBA|nr:hypothetical protein [Streptomyces sp. CBMA152]
MRILPRVVITAGVIATLCSLSSSAAAATGRFGAGVLTAEPNRATVIAVIDDPADGSCHPVGNANVAENLTAGTAALYATTDCSGTAVLSLAPGAAMEGHAFKSVKF